MELRWHSRTQPTQLSITPAEKRIKDTLTERMTLEDTLSSDLAAMNLSALTPLSPEVIQRQATVNIGTIGHVAHGKSTVVKAISGVQTVRFKNELERNITIKLGYANAKVNLDCSSTNFNIMF